MSDRYQRILIASDGSPLSEKAVEYGIELASLSGGQVIALTVARQYTQDYPGGAFIVLPDDGEQFNQRWIEEAQAIVEKIKSIAEGKGLGVTPIVVVV